jgi:hypothetical protein
MTNITRKVELKFWLNFVVGGDNGLLFSVEADFGVVFAAPLVVACPNERKAKRLVKISKECKSFLKFINSCIYWFFSE